MGFYILRTNKQKSVTLNKYINSDRYIPMQMEGEMDWLDSLEARNRAQAKYDKEHTKGVYMKLNLRTDMDIIRWMWAQDSVQGSIKRLIREDICRKSEEKSREGTSAF